MLPPVLLPDATPDGWPSRRRELIGLFEEYVFGRRPDLPYQVGASLQSREVLTELRATRELYTVTVSTKRGSVEMELAVILPHGVEKAGVVLLLSNHDRQAAAGKAPDLSLMEVLFAQAPAQWREETQRMFAAMTAGGHTGPELLDIARDVDQGYWAVGEILASGRAAAAFYASQAQPDDGERFPTALSALFLDPEKPQQKDGWGTLGVWAFAASCMVDVLQQHRRIDPEKISLGGHSRGGKTALWCAAQDERVHAVLVNNSGCTGAALSRGKQGEVVASINAFFPHWFCPNYSGFGWKEAQMPFDQHMLLACVAPRLCYVTSGSQDLWSDPDAEWRGAVEASPAWTQFGQTCLSGQTPGPGQTRQAGPIGYHMRAGGHDLTAWDWQQFLAFLDKHNG